MTGCTCTKIVDPNTKRPKLVWNPDCDDHGVGTETWVRMLEKARPILGKLADIKERRDPS